LNFKKLLGERIQVFPLTLDIGLSKLKEHFKPEEIKLVTFHPKPVQNSPTYALFSRKTPTRSKRLLTLFNRGLSRFKESKKYQKLIDDFTIRN